jgi:NADH-ubiquinone oxidoreductase chain 5
MWIIFPTPPIICLPIYIKLITLTVRVIGGLVGFIIFQSSLNIGRLSLKYHYLVEVLGSMWFIPFLSTFGAVKYPFLVGGAASKLGDYGWFEYLGPQSFYSVSRKNSGVVIWLTNNSFKVFLIRILVWFILIFLLSI